MAGISEFKEFQKDTLRGLVDQTVQEAEPTFADTYLPDDVVYSNSFAYDIIKTSKYIGAMIGYGAEPPVVDRDAVARMSGEIAKFGIKYIATEEELLNIHQARSQAEQQSTVDRLVIKGVDLVKAVQRRVQVIKTEALTKGTFNYNKNGVKVSIDFGIPAGNKVVLTNPNDWTAAGRDVIGDLLDWVSTYTDANNGVAPDEIILSREVQAYLLKNTNIIAEARGVNAGTAVRVSQAELQTVLSSYGLPPVRVIANRKVTVKNMYTGADEVIEFFPANRIVMLGQGVGNFLYGPTVENNFQPGIILQAKDKDEPIESILRAVGAGFPAIEQPSLIFHADVIPAV